MANKLIQLKDGNDNIYPKIHLSTTTYDGIDLRTVVSDMKNEEIRILTFVNCTGYFVDTPIPWGNAILIKNIRISTNIYGIVQSIDSVQRIAIVPN